MRSRGSAGLEAIGDEVPGAYEFRRDTWSNELARIRAFDAPARHAKQVA